MIPPGRSLTIKVPICWVEQIWCRTNHRPPVQLRWWARWAVGSQRCWPACPESTAAEEPRSRPARSGTDTCAKRPSLFKKKGEKRKAATINVLVLPQMSLPFTCAFPHSCRALRSCLGGGGQACLRRRTHKGRACLVSVQPKVKLRGDALGGCSFPGYLLVQNRFHKA